MIGNVMHAWLWQLINFAFSFLKGTNCFWQAQIMAYVEYFGQFTSEQFPEDVAQVPE